MRDEVFAPAWHLVADANDVRTPRSVFPCTLVEGHLEEPLLLTRDEDDELRCMSNVCTHRGMLVAETPCRAKDLRCPYHGRRFGLDGCFRSMPEFEDVESFPSQQDDLPHIAHGEWGPMIFASLAPWMSFEDWIAPVQERLAWFPLDQLSLDASRSRDYLVQSNWALYCDNYLEGFHIPFVHEGLNAVIDYGAYRTELFAHGTLQIGVAEGGQDVFDIPAASPEHGDEIAAYYFWLYPNLMINAYPWGLSINVVKPLDADRTKVSYLTYVADPARIEVGAGAALDRVEREDEAIIEAVQRGVRSRSYDRGRYSPTREQGVHHFHRLLARCLAP